MSEAFAPAFLVGSLRLCASGAMKLRSLPALGVGEIALGVACAVFPTRALAVALALVYMSFAVVAEVFRRRRRACGCFGENDDVPVTLAHVIASELLGTLVLAAAVAGSISRATTRSSSSWTSGSSRTEASRSRRMRYVASASTSFIRLRRRRSDSVPSDSTYS